MNNGGDAAEIIVRLYLEGFEEVVKLSGKGIKELVPLLASTLKQESKTKGKARLTQMIKSGSPLKVFTFKNKDLKNLPNRRSVTEFYTQSCVIRTATIRMLRLM